MSIMLPRVLAPDFCDKYTIEGLLRHWPRAELSLVSAECGSDAADVLTVAGSSDTSRLPCDPPHSEPVRTPYFATQ